MAEQTAITGKFANQTLEIERQPTAQQARSVSLGELVGWLPDFAQLTFPRFASMLTEPAAEIAAIGAPAAQIVAIGAVADGVPIGLALAIVCGATARLLSLSVEPTWRERRIGIALLTACESAVSKRGAVDLIAAHSSRTGQRKAFERTLASAGWHAPELVSLRVAACCGPVMGQLEACAPMHRLLGKKEYVCTPLTEIDEGDRKVIRRLCEQPSCRSCRALRPEGWPDQVEPATSLVLRRNKRLVGWVVTERQQASAGGCPFIHCTAAYIDMALSHTGALLIAYYHAFAQQFAAFGPASVVRFETPVSMPGMFAFIRRRITPVALSVDEFFLSRKPLVR